VLMFSLGLTGCATTTGSGVPTEGAGSACSFCDCARPIRWSARDTDATLLAVREHNAVGRHLRCPAFDVPLPIPRPAS
jgi:hypothetical protein